MRRLPLRVRLVAGFSAVMLVLLTAAGAFVYWRVEYALDRGLDTELGQATSVIRPLVADDGTVPAGRRTGAEATGLAWQVVDGDGRVLDSGGPAPGTTLVDRPRPGTVDVGQFLPGSDQPFRVRVTALPTPPGEDSRYLLVGVHRDHRDEALRELLLQLGLAGLGALAVASLVGYLLARLALDPVERYRRRAEEIGRTGAADLRLDIPDDRDDEVTRLGDTLNGMLAALQESLARERRFVDDASHELRTPLTLLSSRVQLARRRRRSVEEHERTLAELAVDLDRLLDLADDLLALSSGSAAGGPADRTDPADPADPTDPTDLVDLADVATAVVAARAAGHPDDPAVVLDVTPTAAAVGRRTAEQVLTNLLGNAHVHGRPPVTVRVRSRDGHAVAIVSDAGDGMPPELLGRATRRFHRAPEARARPGSGLGLSIVERLVTASGGELRLCHGGRHTTSGTPTEVPCDHGGAMTVTVILQAERCG